MADLKSSLQWAKANPTDQRTTELLKRVKAGSFDDQAIKEGVDLGAVSKTFHQKSRQAQSATQGTPLPENDPRMKGVTQGLFGTKDITGKQTPNNLGKTVGGALTVFGKNVGQDYMDSAKTIQQNDADNLAGKKSKFNTDLQNVGEVAKSVFAPITEAVKPIVEGDAKGLASNSLFKKVANSSVGGVVDNAQTAVGEATDKFSKAHPEISKDISAGLNIAQLLLGPEAEKTTVKAAKPTFEAVSDATGKVAESTGNKIAETKSNISESLKNKQAASIDEKLGLNKNTRGAVNSRLNAAKTGAKTPGQVLTENGLKLDDNAVPRLDEHIEVNRATKQALLENEPKLVSIDDIATEAKKNLKSSGTDLEQQQAMIDKEVAAYKKQFAGKGTMQNGKMMVNLKDADKIKSGLWGQSYGKGLTTVDSLTKSAQKTLGSAFMRAIEQNSENPFIHDLNRVEGDFLNTKSALEGKDLKTLGKPGIVARGTTKILGAVLGSHLGPAGAIAGYEVASPLIEMLDRVPSNIRQAIINNLKETPEGQSLLEKAQAYLKKTQGEAASRKLLGSGPVIPPAPADTSGGRVFSGPIPPSEMMGFSPTGQKALPAPTTIFGKAPDAEPGKLLTPDTEIQRNPNTGRMQKIFKSTGK